VQEAKNGSKSKKGKILFTFIYSLNSGYKGTTDSEFKETFYQYLNLVRLFSLIILINIGIRLFFSFSLSNFAVMKTSTFAPFAKPLYVMVKPVGAVCNLACDYCYYLEKANLYKDNLKHVMSDELLEKFIDEYINSQTMPQVLFTWHGGETLMRPLSFYKKAMELQKKYACGRTIDNCIQTNGTMLTDEWCEFFRENNWLVGVSIDGPQEFHDEYRKNKMGKPSFVKVMQGINLLKKHGVEWNAMAVINDFNADYPLDFYRFFKEIGCQYIQFAPIVERILSHEDGRHLASLAENKAGTPCRFFDHSGAMGQLPLCSFRRMGERRCRQVLCTNIRFDFGELDGRTAWYMHNGKDLRSCRCDGIQRRCLFVRPFCISRI